MPELAISHKNIIIFFIWNWHLLGLTIKKRQTWRALECYLESIENENFILN